MDNNDYGEGSREIALRLLRRSSSRNSRVWVSRSLFVSRLFTSFRPGLKGWRAVGVGNCFEHLTESVGKFWPMVAGSDRARICGGPDERRSYKSRARANTVVDCPPEIPARRRSYLSQPERRAKNHRDTPRRRQYLPRLREGGAAHHISQSNAGPARTGEYASS